ncbi:hypothetical protein ACFL3D_02455 [Candidatus Omnitrophota bacterium]
MKDMKKAIKEYDGVVIIPINNESPILIFKHFDTQEGRLENENLDYMLEHANDKFFSFIIYWKKEFRNSFPNEIKTQYDQRFWDYLTSKKYFYYHCDEAWRDGIHELQLASFLNDLPGLRKVYKSSYIEPVIQLLKEIGVIGKL